MKMHIFFKYWCVAFPTVAGSGENNTGQMPEETVDVFHGHIQEISENKGPVDVFIEEIACR